MRLRHPAKDQGKKIVVIVGGGFGGLNAALAFAEKPEVFVILIDQRNHHLFQPLLYQVATAGLNPGDIAVPIRAEFADISNVEVHWGTIDRVDLAKKFIAGPEGEIEYDFLVLACGAQHSYFAHPEWEPFAPGLKTLEQATEIRRRILTAFELAENEIDPDRQQALLNFVVVGGGATGVELAGAIADISRTVLIHDFKRIDPERAKIVLVEAGPRLMAAFDPVLSERTKHDLGELGVEVRLNSRVEKIDARGVTVGVDFIPSESVFWGAGVAARVLIYENGTVAQDRSGRVIVEPDLSVAGHSDLFVIGDMAAVAWRGGQIVPGLAPAAIQEGRHVAGVILATIAQKKRKPFHYVDKGMMATIGKHRAVMQAGGLHLGGYIAWLAWLFVHIFYLIGFRNRVSVMAQWAWNYLFSKRGARLITDRDWHLKTQPGSGHKSPASAGPT
jgi:NADH dehydrogenase